MLIYDHKRIFQLTPPSFLKLIYQPIKGISLFSNKVFKKGEKIIKLNGHMTLAEKVSPEAVQYDEKTFIDGKDYVVEDFINHNCLPNAFIDWNKKYFVAIKHISKNTEITFDYNTTEYDMKKVGTHFVCVCNSKHCYKNVLGFKYLIRKEKERIRPYLSPFLLSKFK